MKMDIHAIRACKICQKPELSRVFVFCRAYLGWANTTIIDVFGEEFPAGLNPYNLSNHFSRHVDDEEFQFWRQLREEHPPDEVLPE